MPATAVCPSCGHSVAVVRTLPGRQLVIICPQCGEGIPPPEAEAAPRDPELRPVAILSQMFRQLRAQGAASLCLGVFSFLLLPFSFLSYLALAMSAAGLIVGLCDVWTARAKRRVMLYQVMGIVVCLGALALAVFLLIRPANARE